MLRIGSSVEGAKSGRTIRAQKYRPSTTYRSMSHRSATVSPSVKTGLGIVGVSIDYLPTLHTVHTSFPRARLTVRNSPGFRAQTTRYGNIMTI